jgi:hypothetical protein
MKGCLCAVVLLTAGTLFPARAHADKLDACPDPQAARHYAKSCLQENPHNTQETCEARAQKNYSPSN